MKKKDATITVVLIAVVLILLFTPLSYGGLIDDVCVGDVCLNLSLFCLQQGNCSVINLNVINLVAVNGTIGNLTVESLTVINTTVQRVNATGPIDAYSYRENGSDLHDLFIDEGGDTSTGDYNWTGNSYFFHTTYMNESTIGQPAARIFHSNSLAPQALLVGGLGTADFPLLRVYSDNGINMDVNADGDTEVIDLEASGIVQVINGQPILRLTNTDDASQNIDLIYQDATYLDVYIAGSTRAVIGQNGYSLTTGANTNGILVNNDQSVDFGDTGTYINQEQDGQLYLGSDAEIKLDALNRINLTVGSYGNIDFNGGQEGHSFRSYMERNIFYDNIMAQHYLGLLADTDLMSLKPNMVTIKGGLNVTGKILAKDWGNVSINESQIPDINHSVNGTDIEVDTIEVDGGLINLTKATTAYYSSTVPLTGLLFSAIAPNPAPYPVCVATYPDTDDICIYSSTGTNTIASDDNLLISATSKTLSLSAFHFKMFGSGNLSFYDYPTNTYPYETQYTGNFTFYRMKLVAPITKRPRPEWTIETSKNQGSSKYTNETNFTIHNRMTKTVVLEIDKETSAITIHKNLDVNGNITGNQIYGEIWNRTPAGSPFTLPIDAVGIYYNLSNLTYGSLNGFSFTDADTKQGGSYLTAKYPGRYQVSASISTIVGAASGDVYGYAIAHNFIREMGCYARRTAVNSLGNIGITCILELSADDRVNIQIEQETGGVARDISISTANVNLVRIGD